MAKKTDDEAPKLARMKYREESVLDDGAPGNVLLISDSGNFGRRYVLKVFEREGPEDDDAIARARATFEASPKLNHPALVKYHDFRLKTSWLRTTGAELLMEYVEGHSLDQLKNVSVGQWVAIFREVAAALSQMHRRKILHGDLKPSHVMLTPGGRVRVLGYGLSLVANRSKPIGSKQYMAPEQIKDNALTEKTDIYNFGATLYQCLTGQSANVGKRSEGELEKISTPSALNPKVPASLNQLVASCLLSQPPRRPASLYDVQQQLDAIAGELHVAPDTLAGLGAEVEV